jgi:hypothetical protein
MADEEFNGKREVLNLEGCVGLGYQNQHGLKELERVLIMVASPIVRDCITHS